MTILLRYFGRITGKRFLSQKQDRAGSVLPAAGKMKKGMLSAPAAGQKEVPFQGVLPAGMSWGKEHFSALTAEKTCQKAEQQECNGSGEHYPLPFTYPVPV